MSRDQGQLRSRIIEVLPIRGSSASFPVRRLGTQIFRRELSRMQK